MRGPVQIPGGAGDAPNETKNYLITGNEESKGSTIASPRQREISPENLKILRFSLFTIIVSSADSGNSKFNSFDK